VLAAAIGALVSGPAVLRSANGEPTAAPSASSATPLPSSAGVGRADAPAGGASYVGGTTCAGCHAQESDAWRGSHHALAMQEASAPTVLGDFADAKLSYAGVTSRFFKRDGKFYVKTDGPGGKLADYEIKYTFGVAPLQQYLIELPGGRIQALDIAWDTRPKAAGGRRWFHLHPKEKIDFRDVLHWTGPALNWNHMCAECHSTGVRKNYDPQANRFATRWTEIDVACEACHGPGSRHVAWAGAGAGAAAEDAGKNAQSASCDRGAADRSSDPTKGFGARLTPGQGTWSFDAGSPIAHLTGPRDTSTQLDTCGRCHARRAEISEDWRPGQPLAQTHRVAALDERLYQSDGQILGEVYEYGSFLQSRMKASGVTCSDCHDPHSGRLRAEGNAACATCHAAATYDAPSHHHHRQQTEAARCVACHMPSRLYMVIDRRHDHGFRVPRPDLSATLGTPNACSDCHRDHAPGWAADAIVKWYGPTRTRGPSWAPAIAAGRRYEAGADVLLADAAEHPAVPAIARATALDLLARFPAAVRPELVARTLRDANPLIRRSALGLLGAVEPTKRWDIGAPLLADPIRTVRLEAVNALADLPAMASPPAAQRAVVDRALGEYRATQTLNADRADACLNLGALDARLGDQDGAQASYERAIRLQPSFMPAYVNLADLYREQGRDADAERTLRAALARVPDAADVRHTLGLTLVREKRMPDAIGEFARAATLAPDVPRYAYAYALALDRTGEHARALAVLADAQRRFTGDREILEALVQFSLAAGDAEAAVGWREKLRALAGGAK
jgi:tetratricopeptide (TPR) repeat protein